MTTTNDPFETIRKVADATLYEGYVLYPYRASSKKNHARWQFGVLMPPSYVAIDDSEREHCTTELLLDAKASGTAVLLTTHQMAFTDGIADRAIVLGEGEVLDQGPWAAVRKRAAERGWLPADA